MRRLPGNDEEPHVGALLVGGMGRVPGVVCTNAAHGIGERCYVTNDDKSAVLDPEKLARVKDPHVAMALQLQAAFGLRREEAIKFTPAYADCGDRVRIKASWAKGGQAREIPL